MSNHESFLFYNEPDNEIGNIDNSDKLDSHKKLRNKLKKAKESFHNVLYDKVFKTGDRVKSINIVNRIHRNSLLESIDKISSNNHKKIPNKKEIIEIKTQGGNTVEINKDDFTGVSVDKENFPKDFDLYQSIIQEAQQSYRHYFLIARLNIKLGLKSMGIRNYDQVAKLFYSQRKMNNVDVKKTDNKLIVQITGKIFAVQIINNQITVNDLNKLQSELSKTSKYSGTMNLIEESIKLKSKQPNKTNRSFIDNNGNNNAIENVLKSAKKSPKNVAILQAANNVAEGEPLEIDGKLGPKTESALSEFEGISSIKNKIATMSFRDFLKKSSMKAIQIMLKKVFGLNVASDGIFGRKTSSAVKVVQKRLGIKKDGLPGPNTINTIIDKKLLS